MLYLGIDADVIVDISRGDGNDGGVNDHDVKMMKPWKLKAGMLSIMNKQFLSRRSKKFEIKMLWEVNTKAS